MTATELQGKKAFADAEGKCHASPTRPAGAQSCNPLEVRGRLPRIIWLFMLAAALGSAPLRAEDLAAQFNHPPASARPWVYWFWNNGNVTKAGITADLEAMKRAGVGGVIIMDVVERFAPPPGPADFMSPDWQDLFRFAVAEAHRLGIEINMTNGPGWCGSSGPWITPELSMQKLVATNILVSGPAHFSEALPKPDTGYHRGKDTFNSSVQYDDYYADIAVLAIPATTNPVVNPEAVLTLTTKLNAAGQLEWDVPAGNWIIQRIGHTTTGASTRPPVKGGNGLECDKLSAAAMDVHFDHMMGKLIAEVGRNAGTTLTATHIDSWEVGSQNWTPRFREEFRKRRGYDPLPYLPDVPGLHPAGAGAGPIIGDSAIAGRFRWDFAETLSELLAENYVGRLAALAHKHGLRLTLEGYDLPFGDEATYTQRADEPMSEFWATGGAQNLAKARQMASVAHVMGEKIVGAEAFTSGANENWLFHPATIKALGDYEFSQGINRFVIHRYAHQPYLDRAPGATMGPWGLHYERTQTWWEMSTAWHEYLARCQWMLRQGLFVADVCCLRPERPDQTYFNPSREIPEGCKYDECSAEALIARMGVKNGRLVLPDGMSYQLLVLPDTGGKMTPQLAEKIKQLVHDGATVLGPPPASSPSLADFPRCDQEVAAVAAEVWGNDGKTAQEHRFGKGRVLWGPSASHALAEISAAPDFRSTVKLNWIHRRAGDTDIYFVANDRDIAVEAQCAFRVSGRRPESWNPQTGEITPCVQYGEVAEGVTLPLRLEPSGSMFIVFRKAPGSFDPAAAFTRDGLPVAPATKLLKLNIAKATYGVPGDAARTRDVLQKVRALVNRGSLNFQVARLAEGDDPAYGTVKTAVIEYTVDGEPHTVSGQDPDDIHLVILGSAPERAADLRGGATGHLELAASQPGHYEIDYSSGKTQRIDIQNVPSPQEIDGAWEVRFPPKWGAPAKISLDHLMSLSDSIDSGVKYFSGTATYLKSFDWQPANKERTETWLDLGDVAVMARVKLNGHDLGILWKAPFHVNITGALRSGRNQLEIQVANLWPNRLIGDAALPEQDRFTWSSYEPFTKDSALPRSGLLGPVTLHSRIIVPAP